jgi:hypothetical protein
MATINMELTEFTEITDRLKVLESENGQLRQDVGAARLVAGGDELTQQAFAAFRASLPIVCFALANLDPETIRGWPWVSLQDLAGIMEGLSVRTQNDLELALAMKEFAKEAAEIDHLRSLGRHKELEKRRRTEGAGGISVADLLEDQQKQMHEKFGGTPPMTAPQSPADAVRNLFEPAQGITVTGVTPKTEDDGDGDDGKDK